MAKFWYNSNYHSSLQLTPFQALYGYKPPMLALENISGEERHKWVTKRLALLKDNLKQAQHRMKQQADKFQLEIGCI